MMDLITENAENKKKAILAAICGSITVIAVVALVIIASYLTLPVPVRILLILLAVAVAVAGIGAAAVLDARAGYFECPYCGAQFVPTMAEYVKGYHTFTRRRLTCPACGKRSMCRHRLIR